MYNLQIVTIIDWGFPVNRLLLYWQCCCCVAVLLMQFASFFLSFDTMTTSMNSKIGEFAARIYTQYQTVPLRSNLLVGSSSYHQWVLSYPAIGYWCDDYGNMSNRQQPGFVAW